MRSWSDWPSRCRLPIATTHSAASIHEGDPPRRSAGSASPPVLNVTCMSSALVGDHPYLSEVSCWTGNVVRRAGQTCRACGAPCSRFAFCWHCGQHRRLTGTADLVAPVMYAVAGARSAAVLRDYKNHPSRAIRARSAQIVGEFVRAALSLHLSCIETVVGTPVSVRTTLPSLTFRPGVHPFAQLVRDLDVQTREVLAVAETATCHRIVRHDKFEALSSAAAIAGRHVLVLDDVWTTGSNAQSAALTLRRAGATAVSVMVIGRWLNPTFPPTARFLQRQGRTGFDPGVCPVTGSSCPNTVDRAV